MTPEQNDALRKPFPANVVGKLPKGNVMLDYVGHAAVTDRLLAIDPEWTWEPMALGPDGLPAYQNGGLWIRLTVCGVTRIGFGDGPDPKQRISDAIRNAAMRFGVALDLWTKDELEGDPTSRTWTPQQFRDKHPDSATLTDTGSPPVGPDEQPIAAPGSASPASDSLPGVGEATTEDVAAQTEAQVAALRDAAVGLLTGVKKNEALQRLTRIQLRASQQHLMGELVTTPRGAEVTMSVFLNEILNQISRSSERAVSSESP